MTKPASFRHLLALLLMSCFMLCSSGAQAASEPATKPGDESALEEGDVAAVEVDGRVLFKVRGTSSFPAAQRAQNIADRIVALAADPSFSIDKLRIDESQPSRSMVMVGNKPVIGVLDADALQEGLDRQTLAVFVVQSIGKTVTTWRQDRDPATLMRHVLIALGASLVFALALWAGRRLVSPSARAA